MQLDVDSKLIRIAMWSGPRNISTAMMRSWGQRPDTFVCDEPLYANYLKVTGKDHPGAAEIIERHASDWRTVTQWLATFEPPEKSVFYQKHMTHHLLADVGRDWLVGLVNCFLIRDPAEVIASYVRKNADPAIEDVGCVQQMEIFEWVRNCTHSMPPVLDSRDVLDNPKRMLGLLCDTVGVAFNDAMLSWPPGLRPTDGVWAKYWYQEVESSTTFRRNRVINAPVPDRLKHVYDACKLVYETLCDYRLR